MKRKCAQCGKMFDTVREDAKFCSRDCYVNFQKGKPKGMSKLIEPTNPKKRGYNPNIKFSYPLWDMNNPECREVMAFIKTIKPIDFKALAEEERIAKQNSLKNSRITYPVLYRKV